jgi:alkanesulfonate monooxygenase SsuD/methylene tetrahydromethanopterin reductase-like flavin-dependent oxidoreductase (luciferase family)
MIGSTGERVLATALPHVDAWNTWFTRYGNTAEGFAAENARVCGAAEQVGRDPAEVERSACVYVEVEPARERRREVEPVQLERLRTHLAALAEAGADEAILVLDPITESSIRSLRTAIPSA